LTRAVARLDDRCVSEDSSAQGRRGLVAALALATLASLRRFANGAVWDDPLLFDVANKALARGDLWSMLTRSTLGQAIDRAGDANSGDLDLYRPITLLSFAIDHALGGGSLVAYHLTNLALHLACVTLVFLLARELLPEAQRKYAALAAAWFGVSPHLVEAHVWISGRFDELSTCFGLAAIWVWQRGLRAAAASSQRRASFAAAGVLHLLGLLNKEMLVFALPALAFWPGFAAGTAPRERVRALLPFVIGLGAYLTLRAHALHGGGAGVSAGEPLAALSRWPLLFCDAFANLLFPVRVYSRLLKEDYDAAGGAVALAAALVSALVLVPAWRLRKRVPIFAWTLFWLATTLAPVTVLATRSWPGFGRFLYLPGSLFYVGVAQLCAVAFQTASERLRPLLRLGLGALLALMALRTFVYASDFASDDALFGSIIAEAPDRSHGYAFLGMTYLERHEPEAAARLLRKATAIAPFERRYTQQLGQALLYSGQRQEALALALAAKQHLHPSPEFDLLAAYAVLDDPARAVGYVLACLDQDPAHGECRAAVTFLITKHAQAPAFRSELDAQCTARHTRGCDAVRALAPGR
jgi:hypothetical protein